MTAKELREAISLKREWVAFYKDRLRRSKAQYESERIYLKERLENHLDGLEVLLAQKERRVK